MKTLGARCRATEYHAMPLLFLLSLLPLFMPSRSATFRAKIVPATGYTEIAQGKYGSKLFSIQAPGSTYDDEILLLELRGQTRFQQGYDAGMLTASSGMKNYNALLSSVFGPSIFSAPLKGLFGLMVDWQWGTYLSKQTPSTFLLEIEGYEAGASAEAGISDAGRYLARGVTLANLPGDVGHMRLVFADQAATAATSQTGGRLLSSLYTAMANLLVGRLCWWEGMMCSMYAVWGSRTGEGKLYSGRNLDWQKGSGIAKYKLITIHHPPGGERTGEGGGPIAHATIGFSGLWGALAGISAAGLTVHEANLEQRQITFQGFPWVLRLRHIMEHARNLDQVEELWRATDNTVGFTFMVSSASDRSALVMETKKNHTAFFRGAMDKREVTAVGGSPLPDALYRTNHGFDDAIVRGFAWNDTANHNDSRVRYQLLHDIIAGYTAQGVSVGEQEAVDVIATLGRKGGKDFAVCDPNAYNDEGYNVMSVAFSPEDLTIYAAWENGLGKNWVPAACNTFVKIDLKPWLSGSVTDNSEQEVCESGSLGTCHAEAK